MKRLEVAEEILATLSRIFMEAWNLAHRLDYIGKLWRGGKYPTQSVPRYWTFYHGTEQRVSDTPTMGRKWAGGIVFKGAIGATEFCDNIIISHLPNHHAGTTIVNHFFFFWMYGSGFARRSWSYYCVQGRRASWLQADINIDRSTYQYRHILHVTSLFHF